MTLPFALQIYRSNRMELLVDSLAEFVRTPLANPLAPECFLVQGRGMALYLMMELCQRTGICANTEFLYPRNFVQRALDAVLSQTTEPALALDRRSLCWLVLAELPRQLERPEFQQVRQFLAEDAAGLKALQLAERIAELFDQYITYRPDVVREWEASEARDRSWQAILWRAVSARLPSPHLAARERAFHLRLASSAEPLQGLPDRLAIFGLSTLPPLYVRVIAALSHAVDVRLFLFSPCQEYWGDLPTARQTGRAVARGLDPEALHLESQHALLSSLGKLGRDFHSVLSAELEAIGVHAIEHDLYREPENRRTLLGRLQADILHMGTPNADASETTLSAPPSSEQERSLVFHSCHSAMRQVEVLHDQLLALLSDNRDLEPREIVVMAPDIEEYAPLIDAVFDRPPTDPKFIPYRIADRSLTRESPLIQAFLQILKLVGRRAKATEVLDLLTLDAVSKRLQLSHDDLEKLRRWVTESNIRWGIDGPHRVHHGQPESELHTWRFGLRRLLVGYAMPIREDALFEDTLPYPEVEGQDSALLGRFAEFVETLFSELAELQTERTVQDWQQSLARALERLLPVEGTSAWQAQKIRSALARLSALANGAAFEGLIGLQAIVELLEQELDETELARGFLAGGFTFCALVPMRSIPFKVVCLLGLNEGAFPRANRFSDLESPDQELASGAMGSRPGDRSRRDDDRYLFLEALMAARERLILLFTGQSVRDNSKVPPSVAVSELIDHLLHRFGGSGVAGSALEELRSFQPPCLVEHPLQPFSPRYFDGKSRELFSYAENYRDGARSLLPGNERAAPLFTRALARPANTEFRSILLSDLLRFYEGPIRYLLNRRLLVYLSERRIEVPDREPWELSKLEEWHVGTRLLELDLAARSADSYAIARAAGELPQGTPGELAHELLLKECEPIAARVRELEPGETQPPIAVDLRLPSGVEIIGELSSVWRAGQIRAQYSRISGKQILAMWIRHLSLAAISRDSQVPRSRLIGRPQDPKSKKRFSEYAWGSVPEPLAELENLVRLFEVGQEQPLLLFPKSSFEYATKLRQKKSAESALQAARQEWIKYSPSMERIGESADPHLYRVFGDDYQPGLPPPFETPRELGFEALAERIYGPLLSNLEFAG